MPKPATAESRLSAPTPGGIDTDMLAEIEADKAAPENVTQRILAPRLRPVTCPHIGTQNRTRVSNDERVYWHPDRMPTGAPPLS